MLDLSSLQYNNANPGFISILITVLASVVLGTLLAFTYEKTSQDLNRPNHFLQAMILITIVAATIIQAIGDSVARGLGMIGALSIIRFRTTVKNPRNLVFMFSAIAVGIACGVFGMGIAFVGTIVFCLTAFALHFSSFSSKSDFVGKLRVEVDHNLCSFPEFQKILKQNSNKFILTQQKFNLENENQPTSYSFDLTFKKNQVYSKLLDALTSKDGVLVKKFSIEMKNEEGI